MRESTRFFFIFLLAYLLLAGCGEKKGSLAYKPMVRGLVDTVGFAQYPWQMDSLMSRISRNGWSPSGNRPWKFAICPHDDYTYTGSLYPEVLQNVKSKLVILIGVAHKAALLGVSDSLVFGTFSHWKGPWGDVQVSEAGRKLYSLLGSEFAIINDSLQSIEHSLESLIPFLQYFNKDLTIIPILVPSMHPDRMKECGKALAGAITQLASEHGWEWGTDFSIVATTDAVHYGNEDWGGADRAYFGCDSAGNRKARNYEYEIIEKCLIGTLSPDRIKLFSDYTLDQKNHKEYKWTWCGRYSIPVAMYTSYYLNNEKPLNGILLGYSTSITSEHIRVDDIGMGRTAIATDCHWVGYAALGYNN